MLKPSTLNYQQSTSPSGSALLPVCKDPARTVQPWTPPSHAGKRRGRNPLHLTSPPSYAPTMSRHRSKAGLFAFLLPVLVGHCMADGLATWYQRDSGTTNQLNDILYSHGAFLAVGNSGSVLVSTNGIDWQSRTSGTTSNLYAVTRGTDRFVAVSQGLVLTSSDGLTWTNFHVPASSLSGVSWGNGLYVAVGASGTVLTSPDGLAWARQNSGTTTQLSDVTWGLGQFVAVGGPYGIVLTSTDGTNWINRTPTFNPTALRAVVFSDNQFVAVGGSVPVASGGLIISSSDGLSWERQTSGTSTNNYSDVAYGNGAFVAVGDTQPVGPWLSLLIISSLDGAAWTWRLTSTTASLAGVAYGNGSFVAVGSGGSILQSGPVFRLVPAGGLLPEGFRFALTGEAGHSFQILTATNPAGAPWDVLCAITNSTGTTPVLDPAATNTPARFYRAVSQ